MRTGITIALLAAGCRQLLGIEPLIEARDAHLDVPDIIDPDGPIEPDPDARLCFGAAAYEVCLSSPPTAPVTLAATAVDTSPGSTSCLSVQPPSWTSGQDAACFVVGTSIMLQNVVIAGPRPIVFVASTTLQIDGTLDVASHRVGNTIGPASPDGGCATGTPPDNDANGGGGGAGASFMSKGGNGGYGNSVTSNDGIAAAADSLSPTRLRAGCSGQSGAQGAGGNAGGGAGGGAVYLVAGDTLTLTGNAIVNASGAAGRGASQRGGGGGGGSGGMIVLYAPTLSVFAGATLLANGGGGGGGAGAVGNPGTDGSDPVPLNPLVGAAGGPGGCPSNNGGSGAPSVDNGENGLSGCGGGGGGGGLGYIRANKSLVNATVSPPAALVP